MKLFQLYPKALAHLTCKSPKTQVHSLPIGSSLKREVSTLAKTRDKGE